jgi:hypothetical protein
MNTDFISNLQRNGRRVLRHVYYRINVPYYETALYNHDADIQAKERAAVAAYYCEIVNMLIADGWVLDAECMHSRFDGCPELSKGDQHVYCHPQSISGNIIPEETERLGNVLTGAQTFNLYKRDEYEYVVAVKDAQDETALYHELFDNKVHYLMKQRLTTKRRNLYCKDFQALWALYEKDLAVRTTLTGGVLSTGDAGYRYVAEKYEQARRAGLIITPQDGLCRWITDKETPQPEAGVIIVNAATTLATNGQIDALYKRDDNSVLITKRTDYINGNGLLTGAPLLTISDGKHANVRPDKLWNILNSSNPIADVLSGKVDWDARKAWLSYFTDEELQLADEIEKRFRAAA